MTITGIVAEDYKIGPRVGKIVGKACYSRKWNDFYVFSLCLALPCNLFLAANLRWADVRTDLQQMICLAVSFVQIPVVRTMTNMHSMRQPRNRRLLRSYMHSTRHIDDCCPLFKKLNFTLHLKSEISLFFNRSSIFWKTPHSLLLQWARSEARCNSLARTK